MVVQIKATNIELTPELKDYATEKLTSLARFLPEESQNPDSVLVDIELGKPSQHHRKGGVYRCEVNLTINGRLLRAEEQGDILTEAIDKVRDEIEREVRQMKGKQRSKFLRSAREFAKKVKFFRPKKDE